MKRSNDIDTRSITRDPSPNGRTARGQFAKGNPGGPGNPHAKRVAWLREALLEAVSEDDLRAIARTLVKKAKGGDLPAIRGLLNRVIGKATDDAEASPPEVILASPRSTIAPTIPTESINANNARGFQVQPRARRRLRPRSWASSSRLAARCSTSGLIGFLA